MASSRFLEALDGRHGQPDRQPGDAAGGADRRHPDPARGTVSGRAALGARVSRVPHAGPRRRCLRGSAPPPADHDCLRPGPHARARLDSGCVPAQRPGPRTAVRRGAADGDFHRLFRRVLPVLSAGAGGAVQPARGQHQARDQPIGCPGLGACDRRLSDPVASAGQKPWRSMPCPFSCRRSP